MKVCDLIRFSDESYFNGAVQTEWFYDDERVEQIANSYVFHGPKYFGVTSNDISQTKHRLIDTASFTKRLADKIYSDSDSSSSNNFIMTIAGYGTGKSHLAVCLGALFSGNSKLSKAVEYNIALADEEIGTYIKKKNTKRNLIIVLNGMNNFNLDTELLKCARLSLKSNGINDDVLHTITKSYDIAKHFVEKNYSVHSKAFENSAKSNGISLTGERLKSYLIQHVEADNSVIATINEVYIEVNGDAIHWDRGISAGDVLSLLQKELCGDEMPFNKILVLFDEFGRYIEYAAANPTIAGEPSLQQIFESVQDANGRIVFVGFIQSDLSAYLSRIEKTANIVRYVGRYENSEKLYLSSNFETILANLLKKDEDSGFSRIIENAINRYERFHIKIYDSLSRWDKSAQKKSLWTSFALYNSVILKGCYPLHPITTWLLSNTSSWMQQRSTITFAAEMYENIKLSDIDGTWLPYIYPIDIVDSSIYNEMLNSEEKGLVQSQFCMLYWDIFLKVGNKLSENELKVLKAILILNLGKFLLRDKDDAIHAIRYCSNLKEEEITPAIKSLEYMHGVIAFDENAKTYDLIAEASGFNEFKRVYAKYRIGTVATIDDIDSDLMKEAQLTGIIETSFAQEHNISSTEWVFEKRLQVSSSIDSSYFNMLKKAIDDSYTGENPRGYLVYAYCNNGRDTEIRRLSEIISEAELEQYPIIVLFLDDTEQEITDALSVKKAIAKFSKVDQERFQKHIVGQIQSQNKKIIHTFIKLISQCVMINAHGLATYDCRINALCSARFNELFTETPPFAFDGFQNKTTVQAKKYLSNICIKLFDKTLMNIQSYQALTQDEKNRVKSCLSVGVSTSWQVFDSNCNLTTPQNPLIQKIYDEVDASLCENEPKSILTLMDRYIKPPFGMNINAVTLFIFYFIAKHGNKLFCYYGQEKLIASHLSDKIFNSRKPQLSEIKKIRLQINDNAEVDQVAEMCRAALACKNIEECAAIRKKLDDLIMQEGIIAENQSLIAQANMRLDEGVKLLKVINERNTKAEKLILEAKQSFIIHRFIKVFDYITDFTKPLSDEYEFVCGEYIKKQMESIKVEVEQILRQKYLSALSKLKCDITQLSQVKSLYKKIVEVLKKNGYDNFAQGTVERINTLENELKAKQKFEAMLAELDREIAMCSDFSGFSFRELTETETKMRNWNSYIKGVSDLPTSIATPLVQKTEQLITELDSKKNELLSNVATIIGQVRNATLLEHLVEVERNLLKIKALEFDTPTEKEIESALASLRSRIQYVQAFPDGLDDLISIESNPIVVDDIVIRSELQRKIKSLKQKQNEWVMNNISLIKNAVEGLTASECVSWLEKTATLPYYLSADTKAEYAKARVLVEHRLHTCRIEGVVSMFNSLSESEKKQCLEILLKEINIS